MIILYIPFHEHNDLIAKAIHWKETLKNQNILILQYGTPIDYKLMKMEHLTIYILAHGVNHLLEHYHLTSTYPITSQTNFLSIDKIAERFNSDFVFVHSKVKNIKLYFCNNQGNQQAIAQQFHKNLVLFDAYINYYTGTLFGPSQNNKKYSFYRGLWYSSSKVRETLHKKKWLDSDEKMNIKKLTIFNSLVEAKQKRIDFNLRRQEKAHHELLTHRRNIESDHQQPNNEKMKDKEKKHVLSPG
ncbi:hypothetical protein [Legionella sp. WA2022007384]